MADEPRLERGHDDPWVHYLREALLQQGVNVSAVGPFDDALEQAVKQYQSEKGLFADGVVGTSTWDAVVRNVFPKQEVDERLKNFRIDDYPLLASMSAFGEGEAAFRALLIDRGVDGSFLDAILTKS